MNFFQRQPFEAAERRKWARRQEDNPRREIWGGGYEGRE
jgi:hypothetical protein